jgi:maltokinase
MDEHTVLPSWQAPESDDVPVVVHRYRLGLETGVSVRSAGAAWACTPERSAGGTIAAEEWAEAGEGDGAASAFVDLLRYADLPVVPGFRVVRLAPPPEAQGERGADTDLAGSVHSTVVVGERVVVTWTRRTVDASHPGVLTLQHLAAHDFIGVPDVFGVLLWCTPGGHEVPVAVATRYLPRSRDGWQWAPELVEVAAGLRTTPVPVGTPASGMDLSAVELPARLGRLVAKLHLALAAPSAVVPAPTGEADVPTLLGWHAEACREVEAAARLVLAEPDRYARYMTPGELAELRTAVDGIHALAGEVERGQSRVLLQLGHGDLHVGRVLRSTRGLSVVGFDAEPPVDPAPHRPAGGLQPAARDVARLLTSLAEVARRAARHPELPEDSAWAWQRGARQQVLAAYRSVLDAEGRSALLDERLLGAFEAEERARAVLEQAAAEATDET